MTPADLKRILAEHGKWLRSQGGARANLRGANLRDANLRGADLCGAEGFDPAECLAAFWIVPQVGAFTAWKKLRGGVIAQVEIPADARRTSSVKSRKCRAEYVQVLALFSANGETYSGTGKSIHDPTVEYVIGAEVRADSYDGSMLEDCSNGIHFFITRQEAEAYA